jgi:hypothetical protein
MKRVQQQQQLEVNRNFPYRPAIPPTGFEFPLLSRRNLLVLMFAKIVGSRPLEPSNNFGNFLGCRFGNLEPVKAMVQAAGIEAARKLAISIFLICGIWVAAAIRWGRLAFLIVSRNLVVKTTSAIVRSCFAPMVVIFATGIGQLHLV